MSKKQVMQFLNDAYEYGLKAMGELDEKSLSKEFNWNGGKLNKYQFLNYSPLYYNFSNIYIIYKHRPFNYRVCRHKTKIIR